MSPLIVGPDGKPVPTLTPDGEVEILHPQRDKGRETGAALADDKNRDEAYVAAIDAALTCLLDETTPEHIAEKVYENIVGVVEGLSDRMAIKPMMFLTRAQTVRVLALPRRIRRSWLAEYERGCRRWRNAGGSISGKRPILPEIPG